MSNGTPATGAPVATSTVPLFNDILGLMPPVGSNWDDDDRCSWYKLWIEAVNLTYHQSQNDITVAQTPPPAPAPPASTDGSTASAPAASSS
jgi:hypothetical protein